MAGTQANPTSLKEMSAIRRNEMKQRKESWFSRHKQWLESQPGDGLKWQEDGEHKCAAANLPLVFSSRGYAEQNGFDAGVECAVCGEIGFDSIVAMN